MPEPLLGHSDSAVARFCRSRTATVLAMLGGVALPVLWAVWLGQQNVPVWVVVAFWTLALLNVLHGAADTVGYDFSIKVKWYDLWVGAYVDHEKRTLYVCPLPCLLLTFASRWNHTHSDDEPHIRFDYGVADD